MNLILIGDSLMKFIFLFLFLNFTCHVTEAALFVMSESDPLNKSAYKTTTRSSMMIYRGDELPTIEPPALKPDSPDEKQAKEYILGLLECFSPDAYELVTAYYALPDIFHFDGCLIQMAEKEDLLTWCKDLTEPSLLQALNTTVHELCHGYIARSAFAEFQRDNPFLGENERYFHYYVSADEQVLVSFTPVMLTAEMNKTFPAEFQRDRYPIYIYPSQDNMGSQVNGVYGLLD